MAQKIFNGANVYNLLSAFLQTFVCFGIKGGFFNIFLHNRTKKTRIYSITSVINNVLENRDLINNGMAFVAGH